MKYNTEVLDLTDETEDGEKIENKAGWDPHWKSFTRDYLGKSWVTVLKTGKFPTRQKV